VVPFEVQITGTFWAQIDKPLKKRSNDFTGKDSFNDKIRPVYLVDSEK
jgi:hypothetical protein